MPFKLALMVAFCVVASMADTLTLRNGKVIQGTYMGGTERTVKLQVEDAVRSYDVSEVAKIEFTAPAPISGTPATSRDRHAVVKSAAAPNPGRI